MSTPMQRGDFGVVVDNDKPVAIAICIGPGLDLVISLDGTLHPAGPIEPSTRSIQWWPGHSQHILAQVAAFAATAYPTPEPPRAYGETLEPCA